MDAYPLQWPIGWNRTRFRQWARFDTPFGRARDQLLRELDLLGATNITISSNLPLRRDGLPYADAKEPSDPGVVVYFILNGNQQCIPCDKWTTTRDNLQAINKTVEALRGLDRWGAKEMVDAAFIGFKALPPGGQSSVTNSFTWSEVLGVNPDATIDEIKKKYRSLAHIYHPDKGGSAEQFVCITEAYNKAMREIG